MVKPKVLAASWHTGGMNAIIPVIMQMRQDSLVDVVVIGHDVSLPLLKQAGIKHQTIQDYSLTDFSVPSMQRLLQLTDPNLVLTGTSVQDDPNDQHKNKDVLEQTLTLAARGSVLTLAVLDVWMNYAQRFSDRYSGQHLVFLPDQIAIMDEYARLAMLKEGFPADRLKITGNPHFDNLEQKANSFTPKDREQILKEMSLDKRNPVIFYAASVWKDYKEEYGFWDGNNIKLINQAISDSPKEYRQTGLIVKLHPRTPEQDLDEIRAAVKSRDTARLITGKGIDPNPYALASLLTATPNSTVGIQAVYMHRPVISLQPGLKTTDYLEILTKNNLIPVAYHADDARRLVQRALTDENYRREMIEQASSFRTDGKATERVTDLVYETLGIGK